jgi:hypothetical protein
VVKERARAGRTVRRIILLLLLGLAFPRDLAAAEPQGPERAAGANRTAASKPKRLVVDHFQGQVPGSKRIRPEVTRVLEEEPSVDLISVELLDAHRAHDISFDGSAEGFAEVAKRIGADAVIRGRIQKINGARTLNLVVLDGRDGRRIGRVEVKADTFQELRKRIAKELWNALAPLVAQAGAESEETTAPAPEPSDEEKETKETEPAKPEPPAKPAERAEPEIDPSPPPPPPSRSDRACPWLVIGAAGGVLARSFDYENERSGAARSYRLRRSVDTELELAFYPLALRRCTFAAGLGVSFVHEQMVPVTSRVADQALETWSSASRAEIVYRIVLGALSVEPGFGYQRRRFSVEREYVPDVLYQSLRPRLKLRLKLGPFLAEATGAGRFVLDAGQLESEAWFPGASGLGFDASAALGVAPAPWLEFLAGARLERYRFELNPPETTSPFDPPAHPNGVADRAHDHYFGLMLGVRFNLSRQ